MKENSDEKIADQILRRCNLRGQSVLEIGCGDGRISRLLIDETENLIAIDPDETKIRKAQASIPGGKFLVGSGQKLAFPREVFDVVIFTLSLHHQDSKKALGEASRVLRNDGLILIIEPLIEGEVERVFGIVNNEDQEKLDAQQAISESDLIVEHSEVFYAHWHFKDKEELSKSVFDYFDMPFDPALSQKIHDCLGPNTHNQPLKLTDNMIIQALSKNTQPGASH